MSKLSIIDSKGATVGHFDLSDDLMVTDAGDQAVHDVIVAMQAGWRAGTASTLRKGEVAGSNKKPWKQKGTGRARAGYRQSPVWRGGGVAFGPHPRSYAQKVPRKIAQLAFRRSFSDKVLSGEVRVLDQLVVSEAKTKNMAAVFKALQLPKGVLVVVDRVDPKLSMALRNLPDVELTTAATLNTYQMVRFPVMVITKAALDLVCGRLSGEKRRES